MIYVKGFTRIWGYIAYLLASIGDFSLGGENSGSDLTDFQLIGKIREGNTSYYEVLVRKYSSKLYKYIYHYFNFSQTLAEDMVQDVFVKVWNNLDKFDERKNFQTRVYNIARNNCIDHIRKEKRLTDLGDKDVEGNRDFNEDIEKEYKSKLVRKMLEGLEGEQKEVVLLYYFEHKSYEEIAEILDKPRNTVGTLISRAKKKLKNLIDSDSELKETITFDL